MLAASFTDVRGESVDVPSNWRRHVNSSDAELQTELLVTKQAKTQAPVSAAIETQTEAIEERSGSEELPLVANQFIESADLTSFLIGSTPILEEQLLRNVTSSAFDTHDVSWEERHDQVDCVHSLKHQPSSLIGTAASVSSMAALESCTAVAWNASGTVVAAAYGPLDRHDWSLGESMLCTWSLFRRKMDPNKADIALQLQDCLTCLAFHTTDPSILAGGSFNGDVLLFNLANADDQLVCKSVLNPYTHAEPVQQLAWTSTQLHGRVLTSISNDGKLLVWTMANELSEPILGFSLPKPAASKSFVEGGACLAFSHEDPTTFVVGLEAGQLFKCSLAANEERPAKVVQDMHSDLPWSALAAGLMTRVPASHYHRLKLRVEKESVLGREKLVTPRAVFAAQPEPEILYRSPITFPFERHAGPVYGAHFSPFHRNVFLSASTDGTARIYNVLHPRPVYVVEPSASSLFTCAWSPTRPLVFAVGGADGHLYLYDLKRSKGRPGVTLKVTSGRAAVYGVAFNPRSPELLATADGQGCIKIWRLSGELSTMGAREVEGLDRLVASRGAEGGGIPDGDEDELDDKYEFDEEDAAEG